MDQHGPHQEENQIWTAVTRVIPALEALPVYTWSTLRADFLAGMTVAAVAVPQAMAYAQIAGIPPEYGLYTAIVLTAVGSLLNSSKQLINGPTNAISLAVLGAVSFVSAEETIAAASLLALTVGLVQILITLFRLGDLTRYISHGVVVGFTTAAGVLIVMGQVHNILGVPRAGDPHMTMLQRFLSTIGAADQFRWLPVVLTIAAIVAVLLIRLIGRKLGLRLPDLLLAILLCAAAVYLLELSGVHLSATAEQDEGRDVIQVVGEIPRGLPQFKLPRLDSHWIRTLSGSALAIALLGLLEALAISKTIASQTGQKLDVNQQCFSEGMANLAASLFQCFPGSGSFTRSAINHAAGARTQWSGVVAAAGVAVLMLPLAPLVKYVPKAALAGILIVSAWNMIDRKLLVYYLRATRFDRGIVLATMLSGALLSIEFCILIGTFLSFMFYIPRAARVSLIQLTVTRERMIRERVAGDPACDRILLYSLEGEVFFGSAPDVEAHLRSIAENAVPGVRVIVLRLKNARNPDADCLELFDRFVRSMDQRGIVVLLCGVRHDMAKGLRNVGLSRRIGPERIFREYPNKWSSTLEAVRHAYDIINSDLCATCPKNESTDPETDQPWHYVI